MMNNSRYVAGIDYSMTSPAICIYDTTKPFSFDSCMFFAYSGVKKLADLYGRNIIITKHLVYETEFERFDNISEWAMAVLSKFGVTQVCLEGYSMGSSGRVFNIAENCGLLKYKMWKAGIRWESPAPTSVKKLFALKGNAPKDVMHQAFVEKTGTDLAALLGQKPLDSPTSDIVDSYAMVDWLLHHI